MPRPAIFVFKERLAAVVFVAGAAFGVGHFLGEQAAKVFWR
jgi:hypothetical protein